MALSVGAINITNISIGALEPSSTPVTTLISDTLSFAVTTSSVPTTPRTRAATAVAATNTRLAGLRSPRVESCRLDIFPPYPPRRGENLLDHADSSLGSGRMPLPGRIHLDHRHECHGIARHATNAFQVGTRFLVHSWIGHATRRVPLLPIPGPRRATIGASHPPVGTR